MPTKRTRKLEPATNRSVSWVKQFKKDFKTAHSHRKADLKSLIATMVMIEQRQPLPASLQDHSLTGRYPQKNGDTDCRECHVGNDWLLVYRFPDEDSVEFIRTGTHSELFG